MCAVWGELPLSYPFGMDTLGVYVPSIIFSIRSAANWPFVQKVSVVPGLARLPLPRARLGRSWGRPFGLSAGSTSPSWVCVALLHPLRKMNFPMMGAAEGAGSTPSAFSSLRLSSFPGEEPSVEEVVNYLDENEPLVHAIYSFDLRGETPPSLVHLSKPDDLTGFSLITGTEASTPAGMKHNFSVRQAEQRNATRKDAFDAAMLESANSLAQAIDLSLQRNAPLRLKALQDSHKVVGKDKTFNGLAMWRELAALRGRGRPPRRIHRPRP